MSIVMLLRLLALTTIIPLSAVLSGCACPSGGCCVPGTPCSPCVDAATVPEEQLPDLVVLATAESDLEPLPSPTESYQALDAATCQCRAATNLTTANLVELERFWAKVVVQCDTKNVRENLCLDRDLLALHAAGLRNDAAGAALQAFYQLAGLELQKHYLQMAIEEMQLTLGRIDKFRDNGIEIPATVDRSSILSQLAQLEDQKLQLDFTRIQLNGQLQKMMHCPLDEYTFFWPQLDWEPDLTPLDVEVELALGLETRTDLRGLGLVICRLDRTTMPVARAVLNFAESTVGTVEPQDGVIHWARCFRCNETELPVRCRQLALFYEDTEQGATAEIKGAAFQIGLQQQRVVAGQRLLSQLQERLRELEETRDIDDVSVFEISNARAQVFDAQAKLVEQIVQLKMAQSHLRQVQGLLAEECGYKVNICCEGCCTGACCTGACCNANCQQCSRTNQQDCCE